MMFSELMSNRKIDVALDALMGACGLVGESGSERLFWVLAEAVRKVMDEWHVVEQSHKDGLCYNVNALLSDAIAEVLNSHTNSSAETAIQ